jgi:hypothetical protein
VKTLKQIFKEPMDPWKRELADRVFKETAKHKSWYVRRYGRIPIWRVREYRQYHGPVRWWFKAKVQWFFPCIYINECSEINEETLKEQKVVTVWRSWFGHVLWERIWKVL